MYSGGSSQAARGMAASGELARAFIFSKSGAKPWHFMGVILGLLGGEEGIVMAMCHGPHSEEF